MPRAREAMSIAMAAPACNIMRLTNAPNGSNGSLKCSYMSIEFCLAFSSLYHFPKELWFEHILLLVVNLATKDQTLPPVTLDQIDAAMASCGFKKEVRSTIRPGKEYSVTYDGPSTEKARIEEILQSLAQKEQFTFSVDLEESVKFP